jgi:lipid-binding SYLF domain-containing protein
MNPGIFHSGRKTSNTLIWFHMALFLIIIFTAGQAVGKTAAELNAGADAVMDRFAKQVDGSEEVVRNAKGLLIFPSVKKGALILGGEYGKGVLRIGGATVDFYRMISGSVGLQIGGQAKDIVIAFMSDAALKKFRESKGWEAGVDGNIALITVGGGERTSSAMADQPIAAFVFDVKGLIADMSLKGAKFTKLDKSKISE